MSKKIVSPLHIEWSPGWIRVVNVATREAAAAPALADLSAIVSGNSEAIVGVGRNSVFLKALRLPKAVPEDLRRIIAAQVGQIFPLPSTELVYDFFQTADVTSEGCLTVVAAMRTDELHTLRNELHLAGLKIARVLPIALAAPAVAATVGAADALVIENGPRGLTLDVVQNGILRFSRVALADSDPAIEAQRTLAAIRAEDIPIVSVGDIGIPSARPSLGSALSLLHEAPSFSFELPEERGLGAKQRSAARTRSAVLLLVAALLVAVLVWTNRQQQFNDVRSAQASWTRQLTKLKSIRDGDTNATESVTSVEHKLDLAFQPAQPVSDIVSVVSDSLPPGAWLTQMNVERGQPLQLRGIAKSSADVATLVNSLGSSPRFRDVKLVFANSATVQKIPVIEFNVSAWCVGNVPLPAPDAKGPSRAATATRTASTATSGANG